MKIENIIRSNIRQLTPYSSARDEGLENARSYLDANESPIETGWNRYPDPYQRKLKKAISKLRGLPQKNIFLGNGSDEIIDLIIRLVGVPGKSNIVSLSPSYGMYKVSAQINEVALKEVSLEAGFKLNADSVLSATDAESKLIFICSPNNPSGNCFEKTAIQKIIENFPGIVVIDEAYIDFAEDDGWLSCTQKYSNLVVIQTLSKAFGLASLRLGMAFASTEIVNYLNRIKPPYNVNGVTQTLALEAIEKTDIKQKTKVILEQREFLERELKNLSIVKMVYPSDTNFLLVQFENSSDVFDYLLEQSIVVRNRSNEFLCENCLRITVGTSNQNTELLNNLKQFENEKSTVYR